MQRHGGTEKVMPECEDKNCGDEAQRRVLCYHCGLYVCPWCFHHVHGCEPGHRRVECRSLKAFRQHGWSFIQRLRAGQKETLFDEDPPH